MSLCSAGLPPRAVVLLLPFPFFFNDTATTEIYTLSLHDALPISGVFVIEAFVPDLARFTREQYTVASLVGTDRVGLEDRKSTRLNSSHANISYAVFCLKKKMCGVRAAMDYNTETAVLARQHNDSN